MIHPPQRKQSQLHSVPTDAIAFQVSNLETAQTALETATRLGWFPILLSPPDAASSMGFPWWRALMDLLHIPPAQPASHEHPACTHSRSDSFIDILDCGNAAGRAAMALAGGQKHIILSPRCPQTAGIRILATSLGALVLPTPPEAIVVAPGTTPAALATVLTASLPSAFLSPQREKNGQQRPDGA